MHLRTGQLSTSQVVDRNWQELATYQVRTGQSTTPLLQALHLSTSPPLHQLQVRVRTASHQLERQRQRATAKDAPLTCSEPLVLVMAVPEASALRKPTRLSAAERPSSGVRGYAGWTAEYVLLPCTTMYTTSTYEYVLLDTSAWRQHQARARARGAAPSLQQSNPSQAKQPPARSRAPSSPTRMSMHVRQARSKPGVPGKGKKAARQAEPWPSTPCRRVNGVRGGRKNEQDRKHESREEGQGTRTRSDV